MRLRLQPMVDLTDLDGEDIDLAIRWGNGNWKGVDTKLLFSCPAWPSGNLSALHKVQELGLENAFNQFTLLHDSEHSDAWKQWFSSAELKYPDKEDTLIIPDPNVRVEAVINSQGVALNDELIEREQSTECLYRLSDVELPNYGYFLVFSKDAFEKPVVEHFTQWVTSTAVVG